MRALACMCSLQTCGRWLAVWPLRRWEVGAWRALDADVHAGNMARCLLAMPAMRPLRATSPSLPVGPHIPWRPGRVDKPDGTHCPPDGRLPDAKQVGVSLKRDGADGVTYCAHFAWCRISRRSLLAMAAALNSCCLAPVYFGTWSLRSMDNMHAHAGRVPCARCVWPHGLH